LVSDAERFLERAEQTERIAREMTSREHREQLLQIAADWRRMAERAKADEGRTWKPDHDLKRG
jgi:hypothetical protein